MSDFDMGGLANMLGGFQEKIAKLKEESANLEVTGEAGAGLVKVTATGDQRVLSIAIDPKAVDDVELLEDLVRAAVNDALDKGKQAAAAHVQQLTAGLPIPPGFLPGM